MVLLGKEIFMDILLVLSDHAVLRMAQRNLSLSDVNYVICNGRKLRRAGVTHHFLGKKDIPDADVCNSEITRLEGATILSDFLDPKGGLKIITLYRNRSAFRMLKRKTKYDKRPNRYPT
jgi:hypothetical protein